MISMRVRSFALYFILLIVIAVQLELSITSERVSLHSYVQNFIVFNTPATESRKRTTNSLTIWRSQVAFDNSTCRVIFTLKNSKLNLYQVHNVQYNIGNPNNISFDDSPATELYLYCRGHDCAKEAISLVTSQESSTTCVITRWNETLQTDVRLNVTKIHVEQCNEDSKNKKCPKHCSEEGDLWDPIDDLCKTTAPDRQAYVGSCEERGCMTTCFTPDAMTKNSTYPWKNLTLKEEFYPANTSGRQQQLEEDRKEGIRERRQHTYEPRFHCGTKQNQTKKPLIPQSIQSIFGHHLLFLPEHKLLFCGIPKSGITEWKRFFRYTRGAQDYLSWPHFKNDLKPFHLSSLSKEKQEEILNDPLWTKAVFLRDPAERLLSGYLDKIINEGWSEPVFEQNHTLSFAEFIDLITTFNKRHTRPSKCKIHGLNTCTDPHFRPQFFLCGLDYLLPSFDFIGSFQHLSEHTRLLLSKVGMWDEYGLKYDDGIDTGKVGSTCDYPPPVRPSNFTPVGFNQGKNRTSRHDTQSSTKMRDYYTKELLATVRKAYHWDYAIWDDLAKRPSHLVASGEDLDIVRSYCHN